MMARDEASTALREFLTWVGRSPRSYGQAMEAWGSHCPRYTLWEDALNAQLIQIARNGGPLDEAEVSLTSRGQTVLNGTADPA